MKQTYRPWSIWKTFFLSGLLLFVIIRIFFTYNQYILDEVRANVEETLHETLVQQSHNFNTKIIADQESMDLIALQLKAYANIQDIPLDKLQEILAVTTFQTLAIIDLDGNLYATNGVETNIQDRDYFQGILEAKRIVTVVEDSRIQSKSEMLYTSPLYYEGKLYGSVMGTYDTTELQELFLTSFGGKGYSYIVSDDGDLIVNSLTDQALLQTKSILEWYENADFYSGDSFETMMYNLKHQISGIVRMSYLGEQRIIDYTALDVDGWNMMTAIDNNVIDQHARRIVLASLSVSFGLLAMLSFLVVVTLYSKKRREQAIEKIVSYDTLTSATTLSKFRVDASTLLEQQRNHSFVLIKLDIADFKMINRTYGYEKGNLVLKIIAESIESLHANYPQMVYCRFNTDEFLCLFPMMDQHWQIRTLTAYQQTARNVEASLNQPITLPMGCYAFESHENIPLSLAIERVNFAHRKAKIEGKHMVVFEDALEVLMLKRNEIKIKYKQAIEQKHIHVYVQPKVSLETQEVVGAEALVRWMDQAGVVHYPDEFIPVLEEDDSIVALDFFVVEEVCANLARWKKEGKPVVPIAVNISRNHLQHPNFVETLLSITNKYQISADLLELELTESIFIHEESSLKQWMSQVQEAGFHVSMDDFGSGYSSLGLLRSIPVKTIKLDQSFLKANETSERAKKIVEAIINLAKQLDIKTVSEGVETLEQMEFLSTIGCDQVQGYYYAKPMPFPLFEATYIK